MPKSKHEATMAELNSAAVWAEYLLRRRKFSRLDIAKSKNISFCVLYSANNVAWNSLSHTLQLMTTTEG